MQLSRRPLSEKDLLALLNWELTAYEECEGCRFTAIAAEERSAWDARLEGGAVIGQMIARQIVGQTRRAFDLAR